MALSEKEQLMRAAQSVKQLRVPFEAHLREIGENFAPRRTRFSQNRSHKSDAYINRKIINSRPRLALRTMQSGMQSGMTSPARPWFRLITVDPEQRDDSVMKNHLFIAQQEMRQMLQSSGVYNALHTLWGDLGWGGTDAMILENDMSGLFNPLTLVPGEYWIAANSRNMVDVCYREVEFTIKYIVGKFVFNGERYGKPDWDVVPSDVKNLWDKGDYGAKKMVCHMVAPRTDRNPKDKGPKGKPVRSTYWLHGSSHGTADGSQARLLGDLGYRDNPLIASRWDVEGANTYGSSPAMDALYDAKSLQVQERDKREAIRRMNRPPMNAPVEMRNSGYSLMPEAVNYMADPSRGLQPAYVVNPPLQHLQEEIKETEYRIDEAMYANLFLMISRLDRREITAREIDERHEEKLVGLGPVLERQHREKLGPIIRKAYRAVVEAGKVPPLPESYRDQNMVEIDYISTLAQAQKAVATSGIERLYGFAGNLFAVDQEIMDNLDNDKSIRHYGDMLGVPSDVMRPKNEVEERRASRREQMEQQNQMDQLTQVAPAAEKTAQAAKVASEVDATGKPLDILKNLGLR